jgi:leucine-rich repeat transmembrane neuronal protein 1/2
VLTKNNFLIHAESVAYEFGAGRGLIQYQFPPGNQPDTEADNIALGLITSKPDAVLLRIESANTQDYFELEIVRRSIDYFNCIFCNDKVSF